MQQYGLAGDDVHFNERSSLQYSFFSARNTHNNIIFIVYIFKNTFVYKYITNEYNLDMKICIMYFAGSLLKICSAKKIQEFFYVVLLVLSRCCFHHLVENSII